MSYDKKHVTPSFQKALAEVLNGGKKVEEEKPIETPVEKSVELSETQEDNLETLTEEELFSVMEEELGPHIAYLLDEGFSEDEVENIIVDMLESDGEDSDEVKE